MAEQIVETRPAFAQNVEMNVPNLEILCRKRNCLLKNGDKLQIMEKCA